MFGSHAACLPGPSLQGEPAPSTLADFSAGMRVISMPPHPINDSPDKE